MKQLYYQYKMYVWGGIVIFLSFSIVMYVLRVTQLKHQKQQKQSMVTLAENAPVILKKQNDSLQWIENNISKQQNGSLNIVSHNEFIRIIEETCKATNVRMLRIPHESIENNPTFQLAKVDMKLEGNYKNLLRFMFMIENEKKIGKIQFLEMQVEEFSKNMEIKNYLTLELSLLRLLGNTKTNH